MDKDVRPLDLSRFLGKVRNRVRRVGIELEGGWVTVPVGGVLQGDASVRLEGENITKYGINTVGEISSEPILPARIPTWTKKYYPTFTNASCGMHIHMSMNSLLDYSRLMDVRFQKTLCEYVGQWAVNEGFKKGHHIYNRLAGTVDYCTAAFWPEEQVAQKKKDYDRTRFGNRYTIINYCHGTNETLEIRVLPMMADAPQAIRAIFYVLDITNAFIVAVGAKRREQRLREVVERSVTQYYEEEVISVASQRI